MRKLLFLSILCYFFNTATHAQSPLVDISYSAAAKNATGNLIFYTASNKLAIDDFKSIPDAASSAVAITSSGFAFNAGFHSSSKGTTLSVQVFCSFDKNKSWMKTAGKNEYILGHEQLHFDISYLGAAHFIKSVKQSKFSIVNYSSMLKKNYAAASKEMEALQIKYDNETMNGQLKEEQIEWRKKIDELLQNVNNE